MSAIGKLFTILAIVGSLATAGCGFFLAQKKTTYADKLTSVETALKSPKSPIKYAGNFRLDPNEPAAALGRVNDAYTKSQEELTTTQESLKTAQSDLSEAQTKATQLTTEVTETKKNLEEKTAALERAEKELSTASQELTKMKELLGGRELQTVLTQKKDTEEQLKVIETEKNLIQETLLKKQAEIDKFKALDERRIAQSAPLELSGKVVAINKAWNFVVLDVGKENQLVEGIDLTVYRGDSLIGKVRTVSVDENTAIADVLPEWSKSEIQVGDQVLF
ncbi:MAG: hypothetical protein AAF558_14700 [Verrucomicrobiota bacterium]